MNENNSFALVPRLPGAVEKVEPGAKRVLSGMVADTLATANREQARKTQPPRIVIVDDAEGTRGFYKLLLKNWFKEATLQEFENSDDAWKELSQTDPDLLITRVPTSGRFLLPLLAERKVKYPILVTSAFFSEEEVRQRAALNLNVSFLPLPFTAQQFYRELLIHLGPATIPQMAQILTREFELKWRLGARAGDLVAKGASQFVSRITVSNGENEIDAKEQWAFAGLGDHTGWMAKLTSASLRDPSISPSQIDSSPFDMGCGDSIKVSAEGPDAAAAMEALTELFTCGDRVEHCNNPDCSSKPCLVSYSKEHISYSCYKGHTWTVPRTEKFGR